jgi:hypothetical protein
MNSAYRFLSDMPAGHATMAGRRFLDRTRSALAELDYAVKTASSAGRGKEGDLRIGIFSSIASMFIRELLVHLAGSGDSIWTRVASRICHSSPER